MRRNSQNTKIHVVDDDFIFPSKQKELPLQIITIYLNFSHKKYCCRVKIRMKLFIWFWMQIVKYEKWNDGNFQSFCWFFPTFLQHCFWVNQRHQWISSKLNIQSTHGYLINISWRVWGAIVKLYDPGQEREWGRLWSYDKSHRSLIKFAQPLYSLQTTLSNEKICDLLFLVSSPQS